MDPSKQFKILEIDRSASLEQARQAYRDLIAVWHPDRYAHNPRLQKKALEKVKTVNTAYEFVSRFIIEHGPGKEGPPDVQNGPAPITVSDKDKAGKDEERAALWEKTEARLAALARAKELANARKAARNQEAARLAAEEKEKAAAGKGRLKPEIHTRTCQKATAEKARLDEKQAREKAWAETEQKLRALKLAKEKAALARAGNPSRDTENREPLGWYVKQVLICGGILLVAFSGNAIQTFFRINFEAMLAMIGIGLLSWWGVARVAGSRRQKK